MAAQAGVSVTTVSHILNDVEGKRISPETRARVREVAERLGYTPNGMARGLRTRRSNVIGFVSDEIATTPHAGQMILGAQEAAAAHGLMLLLLNTGGDPDLERREIELLLQRQVDGVLYAAMYHRVLEVPERLRSVPTVLLDARSTDGAVAAVVPDEEQGGYTAVRELLDHGHRRIGFLSNVDDIPATHGRHEGWRRALAEAGLPVDDRLVAVERSDSAGGYRAALRLLTAAERPTALFCFNDRMAMGVYRAAAELGLRIPDDLSVIGFDNQELICDGLYPPLTTVALPHYAMGARAIDRLLALINEPGRDHNVPTEEVTACPLMRRASIASPPRASGKASGGEEPTDTAAVDTGRHNPRPDRVADQ